MTQRTSVRLSFSAAVALLAAAVGDPLVETISGTRVFGPQYGDRNHLAVVPAFVAALTLTAAVLVLRGLQSVHDACARRGRTPASVLIRTERPIDELTRIVPLQLAAVYAMESLEAVLARTPSPAGLSWLGAPPAWSLALYVAIAMLCLLVVRWLVAGVASIVRFAAEVVLRLRDAARSCGSHISLARAMAALPAAAPHVREIGSRAPPLLRAFALE